MTQDSVQSLHEAFPGIDAEVINEVLATSGGKVGPDVVNILLGMSDPSYKPEEQDLNREMELRRDAEFARKLAASDVYQQQQQQQQQQPLYSSVRMPSVPATSSFGYGGGRRPRQYSAPPMPPVLSSQIAGGSSSAASSSPTTQTQPPHAADYQHSSNNSNNNSGQMGFKKTSKIRNILRIGRRRSTSTGSDLHNGENEHGSIEPQHQHQHQQQVPAANNRQAAQTLESDFSDLSVTSSSASASSTHANSNNNNNGGNNSKPGGTDVVAAAAPMQNILDDSSSINQRNLLSSYAPLNPSKYQAPRLNNSSDAVDLEHPFDSNPLLPDPFSCSSPPSSRSNNPFAAMGAQSKAADSQEEENQNQDHAIAFSETNPFHKRVYNNNSNSNSNSNSNAFQL